MFGSGGARPVRHDALRVQSSVAVWELQAQYGFSTERLVYTRGDLPAKLEYDPAGHEVQSDDPAESTRQRASRNMYDNREASPSDTVHSNAA